MTKECENIPKIYDIYEEDRKIDIIMEESKGGNLLERIINKLNKGKTFCEKEAGEIFQQIINSLIDYHEKCDLILMFKNIINFYFIKNKQKRILKKKDK